MSTPPASRRLLRALHSRIRLIIACAVGLIVYPLIPGSIDHALQAVIAWDSGLSVYFALIIAMMVRATPTGMRARARRMNIGERAIMAVVILGVAASLVSITDLLRSVHDANHPGGAGWRLGLAIATIFAVWALLHTIFAIHYAHRWYGASEQDRPFVFPGDRQHLPLYGDFLYFSFVIGMTAQVSDVVVTNRGLRRDVLIHGIASFLFNTVILAFAINISASLVG